MLLAAAAAAAAIWVTTAWLLGIAGKATTATDRARVRIDAVRTGLAAGAGAGAAVTLMLGFRRQSHQEYDAAERRITELYNAAAEQLGSDKAPVRLAGLYALERLAQDNPGHRQTIVNVICAYLRMPYTPSTEEATSDDVDQGSRREELQVRRAAQKILATHLRDEKYQGQCDDGEILSTYWPNISLDLSGAYLDKFYLIDCRVNSLTCHDTSFAGESSFRGLRCDHAFFQGAIFEGHTDFRGITVAHSAWFSYSTFASKASEAKFHTDEFYPNTKFGRHVGFKNVTFTVGARFNGVTFSGSVEFTGAKYGRGAETIDLRDVSIEVPNAHSPEISKALSAWPPGWVVEPRRDGTATLVWEPPTDTG
jgi:uncharacterized protein YjbI with pentapeptide repeats